MGANAGKVPPSCPSPVVRFGLAQAAIQRGAHVHMCLAGFIAEARSNALHHSIDEIWRDSLRMARHS
jgi:hypothetical protein